QLCVCCGHECLVECTAGSEAAERVNESGLAGSGHTSCNADSVSLSDTSLEALAGELLLQLRGVDAVVQVAVDVYDVAVCLHHLFHGGYVTVTICTGILLVLANQSKAHCSIPSLLCLDLGELCLCKSDRLVPLLLARLRGVCAGRLCKGAALALNGVEHDAGGLAGNLISSLNSVVNLLYIVAVSNIDDVPAKSVELCADALAVAHDVV